MGGGESGLAAIVPGDGRGSPLVKHMAGTDVDDYELMPPAKERKAVTPEELLLLTRWIDEGADWGN